MAKPDWGELQQQFLAEHAASGVSPKEWCEAQGLNYATAKRYIKIANSQKKGANQTANSQSKPVGRKGSAKANAAKGKGNSEDDAAGPRAQEDCSPSETKPIRGSRTAPPANPFPSGNRHALKHGGYSRRRLLPDDIIEDAEALTLEDELIRIKAASLTAEANAGDGKRSCAIPPIRMNGTSWRQRSAQPIKPLTVTPPASNRFTAPWIR